MGNEENYVDLRVLVVSPLQEVEDLLQVVLEDFRFARYCEAHDLESASDQLMFNTFDLVVVHGLTNGRLKELTDTIRSGVLGNSTKMPIQVFCDAPDCQPDEHVLVSPTDLDMHQISKVLENAFRLARRFHNRVRLSPSRLLRQPGQPTPH